MPKARKEKEWLPMRRGSLGLRDETLRNAYREALSNGANIEKAWNGVKVLPWDLDAFLPSKIPDPARMPRKGNLDPRLDISKSLW